MISISLKSVNGFDYPAARSLMCSVIGDVYCPWDVISYVDRLLTRPTLPPQDFWSNTSSNDAVKRLLEKASTGTRDEIERLIAGETITKTINEELTYKELYDNIDHIWSVLFTTGYPTQRGNADGNMRQLIIPNREIHNIFMTQIRSWMQSKASMQLFSNQLYKDHTQ